LDSNAETRSEAVDDQLIILLAEGRSHVSAAAMAGCSAKTVQRRMKEPQFAQAVVDRRRERIDAIAGLVVGATERAVAVLCEALESPECSERLRAAGMLLGQGRHFQREEADNELRRRFLALEAKVDPPAPGDSVALNDSRQGAAHDAE